MNKELAEKIKNELQECISDVGPLGREVAEFLHSLVNKALSGYIIEWVPMSSGKLPNSAERLVHLTLRVPTTGKKYTEAAWYDEEHEEFYLPTSEDGDNVLIPNEIIIAWSYAPEPYTGEDEKI